MKDRILSLLGSGISLTLVASAVGCEPSYISQLLANEEFALAVATERCKDIEQALEVDNRYDRLEDKLLERLENLLPMMLRPREVLHALQIVNSAKRRSQEMQQGAPQQITNNIVYLQLPTKAVNTFELSAQNEVISIEGKALVPMSTSALMKELATPAPSANKEVGEQNAKQSNIRTLETSSRKGELSQEQTKRLLTAESM